VGGRARLRAASVVAGCLLLAGCQQVDRIGDLLGGPTDAELLQAVSLTPEDAAPEAVFEPYEGGDEVVGRTSLDLCYGDFPSEELRVGRNQVGIGDTAGQAWVSSEAILYGTPDEAEQAMGELERAREECPDTPVPPPQPERDPLTWAFEDPPDDDWPAEPGVRRQAYAFTVTSAEGEEWTSTATYLQRGRMILALYTSPPDGPAAVIRNAPTPARFVEVMGNRLAALPEDALERANPGSGPVDPNDIDT
jgi:hypothetical protein